MSNTYIISDYSDKLQYITDQLNIDKDYIISYRKCTTEEEIHDWLTSKIKGEEVGKIIIPVSLSNSSSVINTNGLLIGLHLRLNYEMELKNRLMPIIFLSNFTIDKLIEHSDFDKDNNPQYLLFTRGVYFTTFSLKDINNKMSVAESCPPDLYKSAVLSKLNIFRMSTTGGHDIGNAWGCYKLSQVLGIRDEIFQLKSISRHLKQLYAKYLICKNESFSTNFKCDLNSLVKPTKKVLFIDDKSNEGWGLIMNKIFESTQEKNLTIVNSEMYKSKEGHNNFIDYERFISECKSYIGEDWDLIIMDLRLNPKEEDIDSTEISPKQLSGFKLIDKFLSYNEGYQIIVSTASNKIWNINAALERGAYSYYIKESPEFSYSFTETEAHYESFKEDILYCFKRSYLRDLYKRNISLKTLVGSLNEKDDFKEDVKHYLDIAYNLLHNAKTKEEFGYSYVSLYNILEKISDYYIIDTGDSGISKWEVFNYGSFNNYKYNERSKKYEKTDHIISSPYPKMWKKWAALYFDKWTQNDDAFMKKLYKLINKRHGFVHNDSKILHKSDKKGNYIHQNIYNEKGFISLYNHLEQIFKFISES